MEDIMAVYRRHDGGVTNESMDFIFHLEQTIPFYQGMIGYFESQNSAYVKQAKEKLYEIRNKLFIQIRYKKNKNLHDYLKLVGLAFELGKFKLLKMGTK